MDRKLKIGAVSYLNTKPLTYGFDEENFKNKIEINYDYPAKVAAQLIEGKIDIGLVPIATIPLIPNAQIISDYCIGTEGVVNSVCLFSRVPIEDVRKVYLDYQSRTSVKLAEVLLKEYWKKDVEYLTAEEDYIDYIHSGTAGVIIGDRALKYLANFEYVYDLGEYWNKMTGLPFVFAAWVANKPIEKEFIDLFNAVNAIGFQNLEKVIEDNKIEYYDLKIYYTQDISYTLNPKKIEALRLFLHKINPTFEFEVNNER